MSNSLQMLYVVNKKLPPGDYRIRYGFISKVCQILYGAPGKTECIPDSRYIYMGFGEGWRFSYLLDFLHLYFYLRVRQKEIDLVHFFTTNLVLFGPIVAHLAGVPSVVTLTGFGRVFTGSKLSHKLLRSIYNFFLGISVQLSSCYFFQNRSDMKSLEQQFPCWSYKFAFVGNAVDFPSTHGKDFWTPKLRVILVTRLLPDKGIDDFIRVAQELRSDSWEFILIGPRSTGFDGLYQQVVDCHNRGIISYKGERTYQEVTTELSLAHVFYFPSCYPEGLSRTMLEAGCACLCPVAYDIPANRDLLVDGRGFLLPNGNTMDVVLTLKKLFADRYLLSSHAHSYQDFILDNYNIERYAERMDGLLRDLHERIAA